VTLCRVVIASGVAVWMVAVADQGPVHIIGAALAW
jgi:hypothetical protein